MSGEEFTKEASSKYFGQEVEVIWEEKQNQIPTTDG